MIIKNAADDSEDDNVSSEVFKIHSVPTGYKHDIILDKSVNSDLSSYFELLNFLDNKVTENDVVNLKLANYGGDLHSGVAIAHSVKNCKGTVIVHTISNCYSMAAILSLCGDALVIYPGNYLMFHNYSGGEIGKAGEIETSHKANKKCWKEYLEYFCTPFLTADEVKSIMDDKDFYFHHNAKGGKARMKRHFTNMVVN